jgi:hypothetical protein
MNVAQETLGFRRQSFSLCLSLLMSAFALPIPPATLTSHLHRLTERSPTTHAPDPNFLLCNRIALQLDSTRRERFGLGRALSALNLAQEQVRAS